MPEELLTVQEVAGRLKVNPETVRRMLRRGELSGKQLGHRLGWRITERDVDHWLESQGQKAGT